MERGRGKEEGARQKYPNTQIHILLSKYTRLHHLYRYQRLSKGICHAIFAPIKGSFNVHSCDAFPGSQLVATGSPNSGRTVRLLDGLHSFNTVNRHLNAACFSSHQNWMHEVSYKNWPSPTLSSNYLGSLADNF